MSYSCPFPTSFLARPDFGTLQVQQYASDYIANKKAKCVGDKKKRSKLATFYCYPGPGSIDLINKTQLNYNLYMEQNLQDVVVLNSGKGKEESGGPLDPGLTSRFPENYTIVYQGEKYWQPLEIVNKDETTNKDEKDPYEILRFYDE
jgi:hypothetical protein